MSHWASDTVFMAVSQFISGIIGFVYRVFLSKHLGPEGMGIYQQTLAFYFTSITFITAGIPLSVSKLVAESRTQGNVIGKTLTPALLLTTGFSVIGSVFLIGVSIFLNLPAIFVVLPAAIMVGFSSVLRGYFLGIRHTVPLCWSTLAESVLRTAAGVFLVSRGHGLWWEKGTMGAVTALTVGELVSLAVYVIYFRKSFGKLREYPAKKSGFAGILNIAVPVSLSQILRSLSGSLVAVLLPMSLGFSGLSRSEALALYGKASGMAFPLIFFPALFTMSLSSNIIPHISKTVSLGKSSAAFDLSQKVLTLTSLYAFAVAGFFVALGKPVGDMLFHGFELKGIIISFAAGIPFFYTDRVLTAILRGAGDNKTPLINSAADPTISIIMLLILTPKLGIYGYAIASITAEAVTSLISISKLEKLFGRPFNMAGILLRPLICSAFMVLIQKRMYLSLAGFLPGNLLSILSAALPGIGGYILLALALGANLRDFLPKQPL